MSDPRSRLSDLKRSGSYRTKQGEVKPWAPNTHQLLLPDLCNEMLGKFSTRLTIRGKKMRKDLKLKIYEFSPISLKKMKKGSFKGFSSINVP